MLTIRKYAGKVGIILSLNMLVVSMNIRSFCYSVIKIISIWFLVNTFLPLIISFIAIIFNSGSSYEQYDSTMIKMYSVYLVFYLIVFIILWYGAERISNIIANKYSENTEPGNTVVAFPKYNILEVGMILLGLYFIIIQTPVVISNMLMLFNYAPGGGNRPTSRSISGIFQPLISIVISIYLIIGRDKIINSISKIRTLGIYKKV